MVPSQEALDHAKACHRAGQLQRAEELYREILLADPGNAEAHYFLGAACQAVGKLPEAVANLRQAVRLRPEHFAAHNHLGVVLVQQGQVAEAIASFQHAVQMKPDYAEAYGNLGAAFKSQGNWDRAVACYQRAAQLKPDDAEASFHLGAVLRRLGKLPEAIAALQHAVRLKPNHLEAHNQLGIARAQQGDFAAAAESFRKVVWLDGGHADGHSNLGNALKEQGKLHEAIACYRRALELKPNSVQVYGNLGNTLKDQGKLEEAVACYRRALELASDCAEAQNNLGTALYAQGKLEEAIACYRHALKLRPEYVEAHSNLGVALQAQGKLEEAAACHRRAIQLRPNYTAAYNNLALTLLDQGKSDEAVACYRRALELQPDYAQAYNNLGNALKDEGKLDEAVACYRRALQLKPDYARAHNNLGTALQQQGNLEEAAPCYRRALELAPDFAEAHSNCLLCEQYRPGATLAALAAAHAQWNQRHGAPLLAACRPPANDRDGNRRLRLGFVSADFGRHPVGWFLVRILEELRRHDCEIVCYSDRLRKDEITARLAAAAGTWRDVQGLSHPMLAEQIRADRIDILFDLAGHTARNRLLVFARKPAPIQITWLGYVGTTGLAAMDYVLADRWEIPADMENHYCEKVLRLPDGYVCYDPPAYAPEVNALPALGQGHVTFGSFNNLGKINPSVVAVWAEVLGRIPGARLVLKYQGFDDDGTRRRYEELFAARGVQRGRLELLGWSSHAQLLSEYHRIDLALDPFPYGGGLTTCEALWMGVPVITCPGETFASRHSLSHMSNIGLTETVARDLSHYVELAAQWASDLPRLAHLRAELRGRMARSPLCDGPHSAANLMHLLRTVWRQWCEE